MSRLRLIELSGVAKVSATAGSAKSSAGTSTARVEVSAARQVAKLRPGRARRAEMRYPEPMPGRLFRVTPIPAIARLLGVDPGPCADEPPRRNIAPGQEVAALAPEGFGRWRWGMIPVGRVNARGRPVMETIVNARGETLFDKTAFAGTGRAVVPADGWYEWTGPARRKTAWAIARKDGAPLFFAAITDTWRAPGGRTVAQLATVTCAPNAEVAAVHDRMGVILAPGEVPLWLHGPAEAARTLIRPLAEGLLAVRGVGDPGVAGR
jgi:putative SOS response-associated peptidase YedK